MQDWLIFLLGLLFAIPLSVFANLITPNIKSYIDKSFLSSNKKRIETLLREYTETKLLRENPTQLGLEIANRINRSLVGMHFFTAFSGLYILSVISIRLDASEKDTSLYILIIFMVVTMNLTLYAFLNNERFLKNIKSFDKYRNETKAKIKRLGGNPEKLDKIDKEIEEAK